MEAEKAGSMDTLET